MKAARTRARNAKHAGTRKHAATSKHRPTATKSAAAAHRAKVHTKALSPKQARARALSLGDVACCSASALGRSLRLAGWPVGADDVLALYRLTAEGVDAGASIWATLEAALRHGLAGVRPVSFEPVTDLETPGRLLLGVDMPGSHTVLADGGRWWSWGAAWSPPAFPDAVVEEAWRVVWPWL